MRGWWIALLIGCGSRSQATPDAAPDAEVDAPGCQAEALLVGGSDVTAQGWQVAMDGPATITYASDRVRLETTTLANARTGGMLLIYRPGVLPVGQPVKLMIVLRVERAAVHNPADAPAAIMGTFTPPFGIPAERNAMAYLEPNRIGWADDSQMHAATLTDGNFHTYEFLVSAGGTASLTLDGGSELTRTGFASNGTLAIGDQTNEAGLDSAVEIQSVTKLCL